MLSIGNFINYLINKKLLAFLVLSGSSLASTFVCLVIIFYINNVHVIIEITDESKISTYEKNNPLVNVNTIDRCFKQTVASGF